jgi:ankyrin repeat protein
MTRIFDVVHAISSGDVDRVKELIRDWSNAEINKPLSRMTALGHAAYAGQTAIVELLMDRGADIFDVSINDKNSSVAHVAAMGDRPEVLALLRDRKFDFNVSDERGYSPFDIAAVSKSF